jgi:hypothetical protein
MSKKSTFSITINGIAIKSDTLYQVTPKPDLNAPDGFVRWETSKLLMGGVQESAPCHFDEAMKVWDTGFFSGSPCYQGKSTTVVDGIVASLRENIVAPYEEIMGADILNYKQSNNEFWDSFGGKIYNGRVINTSKAEDLLELYMAVLHGHVVRPEDKSQHFARKAQYCIINKEAAVSLKEQKQYEKAEAIGNLYAMLTTDKEALLDVFEYIGVINQRKMEDRVITTIAMEFFEDKKSGTNNIRRFIEAKKKSLTKKGKEEFSVFASLTELRRSRVIVEEYGDLTLNGVQLGSNLKDATSRVMSDKDLKIKVAEAIEKQTT